jgi:hypothetical protein
VSRSQIPNSVVLRKYASRTLQQVIIPEFVASSGEFTQSTIRKA